mmetsp:Transcript_115553/g.321302  ORF Transcript_115553/g.321302 Transcript_115553/m.321302 type:complete len:95 (-) Transcript_115553:120-404(-)
MTSLTATMPMVISIVAQKGWKRVKFQISGYVSFFVTLCTWNRDVSDQEIFCSNDTAVNAQKSFCKPFFESRATAGNTAGIVKFENVSAEMNHVG